jgi:hypothetical protein
VATHLSLLYRTAVAYTQEIAQVMVDTLFTSSGIFDVSNVAFTGPPGCAGLFTGGQDAVENLPDFPDEGIVLSTGNPASLDLQNGGGESTPFFTAGDADLDAIVAPFSTHDACVLEFDFTCTLDPCPIAFKYVWGSEEYNEYVGSEFNDVFAWLLNGENIALVPGSNDVVAINSVNNDLNAAYYIDNDLANFTDNGQSNIHQDGSLAAHPNLEADGFTTTLTALGTATPGVNHMKLVLADVGDFWWDSWVLLQANSFVSPPPPPPSGGGGGDPHFRRWGHARRDSFHGECDLVILQATNFHGHGLNFQVRTTLVDYFSYIEAAAVRVGEHVLEVHQHFLVLDGVKYRDANLPMVFGDDEKTYTFELTHLETRETTGNIKRRHYRLTLDKDSAIEFKFYKQFMTFDIVGHPDFSHAAGLLGTYPAGDMVSREGEPREEFGDLGFEWQVQPHEDPILFAKVRSPQLPLERCYMPTAARPSRRQLRGDNQQLLEAAQGACQNQAGHDFDLCVDDVMMTGDLGLAGEW